MYPCMSVNELSERKLEVGEMVIDVKRVKVKKIGKKAKGEADRRIYQQILKIITCQFHFIFVVVISELFQIRHLKSRNRTNKYL